MNEIINSIIIVLIMLYASGMLFTAVKYFIMPFEQLEAIKKASNYENTSYSYFGMIVALRWFEFIKCK
jgi:hypothetical protein